MRDDWKLVAVEPFDVRLSADPCSPDQRAEILRAPGFGKFFTDHMVTIRYSPDRGWHDVALSAYEPLALDPSTSALNYGQAIFEGLKAYRQPDGSIAGFRPERNAERFASSARRIAMPELPSQLFLDALRLLVSFDHDWVPTRPGESLYLRPLMLATDARLITRASDNYLFVLFASPVADYFPNGPRPVSVWLSTDYIRAAPGGTGEAKFAGNYAATMLAQRQAADHGCDQVVWLDAAKHEYVEELGGMNLFFVTADNRLVTPNLTGTLLRGVVRDSILTLGNTLGLTVEERPVSVDEWRTGAERGDITETFACGTAAVVTPVAQAKYTGGAFRIGDGEPGKITTMLRDTLTGIQQGTTNDPHGWRYPLHP